MLDANRQKKLDVVLEKLRTLPGIESVNSDDFDSQGVNVFWWLQVANTYDKKPMQFKVPLKEHTRNLAQAFKELDVRFRVIDYPVMQREYVSVHSRSQGDPKTRKIGYDSARFGVEVFV
jgi:hypothetical protein